MNDSETTLEGRGTVDLNADLGEGFPDDRLLMEKITSASVCCGAHAGDGPTIMRTLEYARQCGVIVGAHPGFPDREGFGRREWRATASEVESLILEQVEFLRGLSDRVGLSVRFLKPHGALYNQGQREAAIADGIIRAAIRLGLPLLGQPGSLLQGAAIRAGHRYVVEGFPDRRYRVDGSLAPRSEPGALIQDLDELEEQVGRLIGGGIETLCIHGDDPAAVANADRVRHVLNASRITIRGFLDREPDR